MNAIENYVLPEGRSLGLKVVWADGRPESSKAPEGFRWNLDLGGETEALDWDPKPDFGGGLHVWEWAQGDLWGSTLWYQSDVVWLAVEYETSSAVDLTDLVKVPRCKTVALSKNKQEIVSFIKELMPPEKKEFPVLFDVKEVEEGDVAVGEGGTAVTKDNGWAEAGAWGTAMAGECGTAGVGHHGTAIAGNGGRAFADQEARAIAGAWGMAIAGPEGFAEAGDFGMAITHDHGTAKVGFGGKAKAGKGGKLIFTLGLVQSEFVKRTQARYQEALASRRNAYGTSVPDSVVSPPKCTIVCDNNGSPTELIVYVNFDGIKPNTFYTLDDSGTPVEVGE